MQYRGLFFCPKTTHRKPHALRKHFHKKQTYCATIDTKSVKVYNQIVRLIFHPTITQAIYIMSLYTTLMLCVLCTATTLNISAHAEQQKEEIVTLKNGTYARKARVQEVCRGLQLLDKQTEVFHLYYSCDKCRKKGIYSCRPSIAEFYGRKRFKAESVEKFDNLKISINGVVDQETQNIILAVGTVMQHDWHDLDPISKPFIDSIPVVGKIFTWYVKWLSKSLEK